VHRGSRKATPILKRHVYLIELKNVFLENWCVVCRSATKQKSLSSKVFRLINVGQHLRSLSNVTCAKSNIVTAVKDLVQHNKMG
jgi:hypothetical protein